MKMKLKLFSLATLIAFATSLFFTPGTPLLAKEDSKTQFPLSSELGTVAFLGSQNSASPTVFYIQDAHSNYEAQGRIRDILKEIVPYLKSRTLLMEGASSSIDPNVFRFTKSADLNKQITDRLAQKGFVTGDELFSLEPESKNVSFVGLEEEGLYEKERQAFMAVVRLKPDTEHIFSVFSSQLNGLKARAFNPKLKEIDRKFQAYESGKISLLSWFDVLRKLVNETLGFSLNDPTQAQKYPNLVRLAISYEASKKLDAEKLDVEKKELIGTLSRIQQNPAALIQFVKRLGDTNSNQDAKTAKENEALAFKLVQVAKQLELDWSKFLEIRKELITLLLSQEMESDGLFGEMETLKEALYTKLARTEKEKEAISLDHDLRLLKDLLSLEATREVWEKAKSRTEEIAPSRWIERVKQIDLSSRKVNPDWVDQLEVAFKNAIEFYSLAEAREKIFAERIQKALARDASGSVIVVGGGFHTEGLAQALSQKNFNFAVIQPRIEKKSDSTLYYQAVFQTLTLPFQTSKMRARLISAMKGNEAIRGPMLAEALNGLKEGNVKIALPPNEIAQEVSESEFVRPSGGIIVFQNRRFEFQSAVKSRKAASLGSVEDERAKDKRLVDEWLKDVSVNRENRKAVLDFEIYLSPLPVSVNESAEREKYPIGIAKIGVPETKEEGEKRAYRVITTAWADPLSVLVHLVEQESVIPLKDRQKLGVEAKKKFGDRWDERKARLYPAPELSQVPGIKLESSVPTPDASAKVPEPVAAVASTSRTVTSSPVESNPLAAPDRKGPDEGTILPFQRPEEPLKRSDSGQYKLPTRAELGLPASSPTGIPQPAAPDVSPRPGSDRAKAIAPTEPVKAPAAVGAAGVVTTDTEKVVEALSKAGLEPRIASSAKVTFSAELLAVAANRIGRNFTVGDNAVVDFSRLNPANLIKIGDNFQVQAGRLAIVAQPPQGEEAMISIGNNARFVSGEGTFFAGAKSQIQIGDDFVSPQGFSIEAAEGRQSLLMSNVSFSGAVKILNFDGRTPKEDQQPVALVVVKGSDITIEGGPLQITGTGKVTAITPQQGVIDAQILDKPSLIQPNAGQPGRLQIVPIIAAGQSAASLGQTPTLNKPAPPVNRLPQAPKVNIPTVLTVPTVPTIPTVPPANRVFPTAPASVRSDFGGTFVDLKQFILAARAGVATPGLTEGERQQIAEEVSEQSSFLEPLFAQGIITVPVKAYVPESESALEAYFDRIGVPAGERAHLRDVIFRMRNNPVSVKVVAIHPESLFKGNDLSLIEKNLNQNRRAVVGVLNFGSRTPEMEKLIERFGKRLQIVNVNDEENLDSALGKIFDGLLPVVKAISGDQRIDTMKKLYKRTSVVLPPELWQTGPKLPHGLVVKINSVAKDAKLRAKLGQNPTAVTKVASLEFGVAEMASVLEGNSQDLSMLLPGLLNFSGGYISYEKSLTEARLDEVYEQLMGLLEVGHAV